MSGGPSRAFARLAHDVGKYVARAARNVREGEVPPPLVDMLVTDLYLLKDGQRASAVLARLLADHGPEVAADVDVARAVALLGEADALEAGVRGGRAEDVRRAAAIAREVEERLRSAAERARGGGP